MNTKPSKDYGNLLVYIFEKMQQQRHGLHAHAHAEHTHTCKLRTVSFHKCSVRYRGPLCAVSFWLR